MFYKQRCLIDSLQVHFISTAVLYSQNIDGKLVQNLIKSDNSSVTNVDSPRSFVFFEH